MNAGITKPEDIQQETSVPQPVKAERRGQSGNCSPYGPEGFELLDEIGRGGMGIIYRARDLSLDRDIAIKVLQEKYDAASTHALRFMEEARITGRLQHPGVPAVHEVGKLADGRPYLVMKLIRGFGLHELIWKKIEGQSVVHTVPDNCLGIFEAICQAVGYAHAHDVIHRDLKPHNIMVGAFGEVQVMDWGLAKVIDSHVVNESLAREQADPHVTIAIHPSTAGVTSSQLTVAGSVLGTPGYMAPEQALGANATLDARADVFGLGAILAAMLTGKPPFLGETPENTRMLAAMGLIQDCFDRLDACTADPDLIALAKRCLAVQRVERPRDGGEVAMEVAKLRAAADERARAAELERAKAEVQVAEQRRRRRISLIASGIVVTTLLAGIVASTWGLLHVADKEREATQAASKERDAKEAEAIQHQKAVAKEAETQSILDFVLNRVIAAARPMNWEGGKGAEVRLRDALESSLLFIGEEFNRQPVVEGRIRQTVGESFWYLGEYTIAEKQLERALELHLEQLGRSDKQTLDTMLSLAKVQSSLGKHQDSLRWREQVYQSSLATLGEQEHLTQRAMNALAASYEQLGRKADVLKLREEVVKLTKAKLGLTHGFTLISMTNLALTYFQQGRHEEAIQLLKESVTLQEKHIGPQHAHTLASSFNLAVSLDHLGRYQEALPIHQKVLQARQLNLGLDHPDTLNSMRNLAFSYSAQGRYSEAFQLLQTALPSHDKRLGKVHAETLDCLRSNITCLFDMKRSADALPLIALCLERTQGQAAYKELESVMYLLRFRHEHSTRAMTACQTTLVQWEKLMPLDGENTLELGQAWAMLSQLKKEVLPADGVAEADKAMEYIRKASELGWNVVKAMEEAKSLAVLHGRDDFRLLLAKLKEKK